MQLAWTKHSNSGSKCGHTERTYGENNELFCGGGAKEAIAEPTMVPEQMADKEDANRTSGEVEMLLYGDFYYGCSVAVVSKIYSGMDDEVIDASIEQI